MIERAVVFDELGDERDIEFSAVEVHDLERQEAQPIGEGPFAIISLRDLIGIAGSNGSGVTIPGLSKEWMYSGTVVRWEPVSRMQSGNAAFMDRWPSPFSTPTERFAIAVSRRAGNASTEPSGRRYRKNCAKFDWSKQSCTLGTFITSSSVQVSDF